MERPSLDSIFKNLPKSFAEKPVDEMEVVKKALRGPKGDKGDKGDPGKDADHEVLAEKLIEPVAMEIISDEEFREMVKGEPGKDGKDGKDGTNGEDGEDATFDVYEIAAKVKELLPEPAEAKTDTPKEIIEKINKSRGSKIKKEKVEGFDDIESMARTAQHQVQNFISLGGNRATKIKVNGVVYTGVDTLSFTSGVTATPVGDGTTLNLAVSGGSSTTFYTETPSGAIDGANTSYTVAHTITTIFSFAINGQYLHPTADYTFTGTTITMVTALPASLSGLPFTIVYS